MKTKTVFKLLLDITMLVLYILLMFAGGLGEFFHEVVGIGVGVLFILHVGLNWAMWKGLWKQIRSGSCGIGRTMLFVSDLILPFGMLCVIVTGILIAKELVFFQLDIDWMLIYNIHNITSYICLGILGGHALLHAKYLIGVVKKLVKSMRQKEVLHGFARFGAGLMAAAFLYVLVDHAMNPDTATADADATADANQASSTQTQKDGDTSSSGTTEIVSMPTLADYLGTLYCTGCHYNCALTNPRCVTGETLMTNATTEYYETYGTEDSLVVEVPATSDTSDDTTSSTASTDSSASTDSTASTDSSASTNSTTSTDSSASTNSAANNGSSTSENSTASTDSSTSSGSTTSADTKTDDKSGTATTDTGTSDTITLADYLSTLYCTACGHHCPLSSPRCGKGQTQAQTATSAYYAEYGEA